MKNIAGFKKLLTKKKIIIAGSLLGVVVVAVAVAVPVALLTGASDKSVESPGAETGTGGQTPGSGSENQTPGGSSETPGSGEGTGNQSPGDGSGGATIDAELQAFMDKYPGSVQVESNSKTVVSQAFKDEQLGPDFVLPASITNVADDAFAGSTLMNGLVLPDPDKWNLHTESFDATLFEENHFWEHSDLRAGTAVVPVEQNDEYQSFNALHQGSLNGTKTAFESFQGASLPSDFKLPSFITEIGDRSFHMARDFPADFSLPQRLTRIDSEAFSWAKLPTPFWIPDGVSYLGNYSFDHADLGNDFRLPASLKEIGMDSKTQESFQVFWTCVMPANFVIPEAVTDVGSNAFLDAVFPPGFQIPSNIRIWSAKNGVIQQYKIPVSLNSKTAPGYKWSGGDDQAYAGAKVVPE